MAWRPYEFLVGGEMEFKNGRARGYGYFLTLGLVRFNLKQNYIVSGRVRFEKPVSKIQEDMKTLSEDSSRHNYLKGFNKVQKGELGDFATGKDDNKYADYFYFEWYSDSNGRVVYEGESGEVEILEPLVFSFPQDHKENQHNLMGGFITDVCKSITEKSKTPVVGIQFPAPKQE